MSPIYLPRGHRDAATRLSIARIIEPSVASVLVADTRRARDDAREGQERSRRRRVIAKLLAAGMLPGVWACDEATRVLRRRIARRTQLVRRRTPRAQSDSRDADQNLGGRGPARDILAKQGREWLQGLQLPDDERATILSCIREADFLAPRARPGRPRNRPLRRRQR